MSFVHTISDENPLGEVDKNYMPKFFFFEGKNNKPMDLTISDNS